MQQGLRDVSVAHVCAKANLPAQPDGRPLRQAPSEVRAAWVYDEAAARLVSGPRHAELAQRATVSGRREVVDDHGGAGGRAYGDRARLGAGMPQL